MGFAIGFALLHGQTTKPELFRRRIANGPLAGLFGQFHQADLLGGFFHLVDLSQGLWADLIGGRLRWQWLTGRNDLAARERHFGLGRGRRGFCARFLNFRDLGRGHFRRSLGLGRCLGLGVRFGGCGLACAAGPCAVAQPQTVDLANHCVARDAPQFFGDLAGGLALPPHLFQHVYAVVSPGHISSTYLARGWVCAPCRVWG